MLCETNSDRENPNLNLCFFIVTFWTYISAPVSLHPSFVTQIYVHLPLLKIPDTLMHSIVSYLEVLLIPFLKNISRKISIVSQRLWEMTPFGFNLCSKLFEKTRSLQPNYQVHLQSMWYFSYFFNSKLIVLCMKILFWAKFWFCLDPLAESIDYLLKKEEILLKAPNRTRTHHRNLNP